MTNDRNYLRMMHDGELTHYAKEHGTTELEFVLLERLCTLLDVDEQLEAMTNERDEIAIQCDVWREEAITVQAQLDATRGYGPDE
jgi:hypothetical protein